MNAKQIEDIRKHVEECTDLGALGRIAAANQYDSWYDPCGKSGQDFNPKLSVISTMCLRRIGKLIGLEK